MQRYWRTAWVLLTTPPLKTDPMYKWSPWICVWESFTWLVFWGPRMWVLDTYSTFRLWLAQGQVGSAWWSPAPYEVVTCCQARGQLGIVKQVRLREREADIRMANGVVVTAPFECISAEFSREDDYEHG